MKRNTRKHNFEEALQELEQITLDLEEGNLSLEDSLDKFDQGMKLAEFCNQKLGDAQKRVETLLKKNRGISVDSPVSETEGDE